MKKVLIVVISALLVLSVAIVASAATTTKLYLEVIPSGTYNVSIPSEYMHDSALLSGILFGAEFGLGNSKVGIEYGSTSSMETSLNATNESMLDLKYGFRVVNTDSVIVDLICSYYIGTIDIPASDANYSFSGLLMGTDAAFSLSPQIIINGSYQFSILSSSSEPATCGISLLSIRANYFIFPNFALTGGYRAFNNKLTYSDYSDSAIINFNFNGITLGLLYKL